MIFKSWLQGYDVERKIVQKCLDSVQRFSESKMVINITRENFEYSKYCCQ